MPHKLTQQERIWRSITEDQWQTTVIDLAHAFKWVVAHFRPALTKHGWRTPVSGDGQGFPDLVLVRERVLWVELKRMGGKLSAEQEQWKAQLEQAGQEVYVWRPNQAQEVADTLR